MYFPINFEDYAVHYSSQGLVCHELMLSVDSVEFVVQVSAKTSHCSSHGKLTSSNLLFPVHVIRSRNSLPERTGKIGTVQSITNQ